MREILFRGKLRLSGNWAFSQCPNAIMSCGVLTYDFIPETVGQFTGLTDKNGKKIFEGDIIAFTCNDGTKHFSVVKYGTFNCSCCDGVYGWYLDGECGDIRDLDPDQGMLKYITVEGNIHDNPDLLQGGE